MPRLLGRSGLRDLVLMLLVAGAAVIAYTRFSDLQTLGRDEAIYVYGGQRLAHGVAPYASIVDPKNPGTTLICGASVAVARLFGVGDLHMIRRVFLVIAVLTAVAMYLLGRALSESAVGGIVAAAVFVSFRAWALDANAGPDALMPGVLFAVLALTLGVRRRWLWAGVCGALAFIVWQPLLIYVLVVVLAAWCTEAGRRWRAGAVALLGAAVPVAALAVYFVSVGAFGDWVAAAFLQPPTVDTWVGLRGGITRITSTVTMSLGSLGTALFWVGTALVVVLALAAIGHPGRSVRERLCAPVVTLVLPSLVLVLAFSILDFLHYPHLYPLLPYPCVGVAGVAVLVVRLLHRRRVQVVLLGLATAAAVALTSYSVVSFVHYPADNHGLRTQQQEACVLQRVLGGGRLYELGDPTPLVLTNRVNPDRYIYFQGGVLGWKLRHLRGGVERWLEQIRQARPTVVELISSFQGPLRGRVASFLYPDYRPGYIGDWRVFVLRSVAQPLLEKGSPPVACGAVEFATVRSASPSAG